MTPDEPLKWKARARREFHPAAGLALMAMACVALVAWVRIATPSATTETIKTEQTQQLRVLRFIDQSDGSISVIDTSTDLQIQRFEGEQGFLRGTLRALVRERRLRGSPTETANAFELIAHSGGRLTLRDPVTGTAIALESFGSTNLAVFAQLMR